jgi:hypothetical protein
VSIVINERGMQELFVSRPVGVMLETHGDRIARSIRARIDAPYPGGRNPPPGPVFRRSGDLRDHTHRTAAIIETDTLTVYVRSNAQHRGFTYATKLLERGYRFVTVAILRGR